MSWMPGRSSPITALLRLALAVTACPAASGPQPAPIDATGTYQHPASGVAFTVYV